jgi:hypothetical protein
MSAARKAARVQEVLAALGLSHTAHTLVGGQLLGGLLLRGLSGGERKRLCTIAPASSPRPRWCAARLAPLVCSLPSVLRACVPDVDGQQHSPAAPRLGPCCSSAGLPAASIPFPPQHHLPPWPPPALQVFLDEPTSGLDSFAALTVMGHLKRMAAVAWQVVLASIHQPRGRHLEHVRLSQPPPRRPSAARHMPAVRQHPSCAPAAAA